MESNQDLMEDWGIDDEVWKDFPETAGPESVVP